MFNLLKADLLKLKWSKTWIISLLAVILLFIIYMSAGDAAFVYGGNDYVLGKGVGFASSLYADTNNPLPGEVMRTAMSYTAFIWLIILVFSVSFFTKEYSENTIKLSIAYGQSRFKLFLSKLIIIFAYSFILYYAFTLFIFIHASIVVNFTPSIADILMMLKLTTLNFLVLQVFILMTLTLSMIIKNTGLVTTIMCFIIFTCPMIYAEVWNHMEKQSFLIKAYLKINPMYYWSTICAYNIENNIINESIIYFIISMIILIPSAYTILKKQEIK